MVALTTVLRAVTLQGSAPSQSVAQWERLPVAADLSGGEITAHRRSLNDLAALVVLTELSIPTASPLQPREKEKKWAHRCSFPLGLSTQRGNLCRSQGSLNARYCKRQTILAPFEESLVCTCRPCQWGNLPRCRPQGNRPSHQQSLNSGRAS